jgi:hypothetical protein
MRASAGLEGSSLSGPFLEEGKWLGWVNPRLPMVHLHLPDEPTG